MPRLTVIILILGAFVLLGFTLVLREPILVRWYRQKLDSEDDGERRLAAQRLAEIRSPTALRTLIGSPWSGGREFFDTEEARRTLSFLIDAGSTAVASFLIQLSDSSSDEFVKVLHDMEDKSLPVLLDCLSHRDERVRYLAVRSLVRRADDWSTEKPAKEAVPALLRRLDDPNTQVRGASACALWRVRSRMQIVRREIRRALKDDDWRVREWAADALTISGTLARCALPELISALEDTEPAVRQAAARALAACRSTDPLPALVRALNDSDGGVREVAAAAVGHVADRYEVVRDLVPKLIDMLPSGQGQVREAVVRALGNLGAGASAAIPELRRHFATPQGQNAETCWALCRMGPAAGVAMNDIVSFLNRENTWRWTTRIVIALGEIGPNARAAVPYVAGILSNPRVEDGTRKRAPATLLAIDPSPETSALLLQIVEDGINKDDIRYEAVRTLAKCKDVPKRTRSVILNVFQDRAENTKMRAQAAATLGALYSNDEEILAILLHALRTEKPYGGGAAEGLAAMGGRASEAVPLLKRIVSKSAGSTPVLAEAIWRIDPSQAPFLVDELLKQLDVLANEKWTFGVVNALAEMGPAAAPATPALVKRLRVGREDTFRDSPADALRAIGRAAVPELVRALESDDVIVRAWAAEILGSMESDAESALPSLRVALHDEDDEVRREASKAIQRLESP